MKIDINLWKYFTLCDYFEPSKGKRFTSVQRKVKKGIFPYISSISSNNGVSDYVNDFTHEGKLLTVVCYGEPSVTNYHEGKIWVSDSVNVLQPLFEGFNIYVGLFLKTIIASNKFLFNYNRGLTIKRLNKLKVKLPANNKNEPDWDFMENYIKGLDYNSYLKKGDFSRPYFNKSFNLKSSEFKDFLFQDLFKIKKGKRMVMSKLKKGGKIPFVASGSSNNGIKFKTNLEPNHKGNTITVTYNGSIGEAFYQPNDFWASDDVNVLYPKFKLNPYVAMFLITVIRKEKYRFNYGRKWHKERMEKSEIKLPINANGDPDWEFMENYIKSLKFSSSLN